MRTWTACIGLLLAVLPFASAEDIDAPCGALEDPDTSIFEGGPVDDFADNQGERTADMCGQLGDAATSTVDDGEGLVAQTEEQVAGDATGTACWLAPGTPGC